jgi:hypothetical protein
MWQCGSSSTPITQFGPTILRAVQEVALDVVVAVRHHRAVQSEQDAVERQRGRKLAQDRVAHELVGLAAGRAGGARRKTAALDQREAVALRAPAGDEQRRRTHARRVVRMLAGPEEHALLVRCEAGRQRRKSIRLGRKRSGEQAHYVKFPQKRWMRVHASSRSSVRVA